LRKKEKDPRSKIQDPNNKKNKNKWEERAKGKKQKMKSKM